MNKNSTVKRAVILAAGLGTRMLPISRAVPKEILPVVDMPAISYLVEEAVNSGIEEILIITSRGKGAIEDYFDYSPEYEQYLASKGKHDEIERMRRIAESARIYFVRQKEARGTAHALKFAEAFCGREPFAVFYGDDLIVSEVPVCAQLISAYEKYGRAVCGVHEVPTELVKKYCSLRVHPIEGAEHEFFVDDMIEKPEGEEQIWSNYSILGRLVLTPDIFDIIKTLKTGAAGEYQLTDAMASLARQKGMTAVDFEGQRFDMGSKLGFMQASVTAALRHAEIGEDFRAYLKELAKGLE